MEMQYNTAQPHLIISEYGRHVQDMALHLLTIKDRRERSKATEAVIQTMTQVHPYSKDSEELRRKLWDHLHLITGFKLDVDSPYEKPLPEAFQVKPERLKYPNTTIRHKHYGKIVDEMIKKAALMEDNEERDVLIAHIAALMKKGFMTWNKCTVDDNTIIKDLKEISKGKLILKDASGLAHVHVQLTHSPINKPQNFQRNKFNNNKGGGQNRNRKKNKNKNRNGGF
jgi:Domain of unknown function (DUF4290)